MKREMAQSLVDTIFSKIPWTGASPLPAVPLMGQFYAILSGASLKQQVVVLTLLGWLTDTGGNSGGILPSAQPVSTFSDHSHKVLMPKQ